MFQFFKRFWSVPAVGCKFKVVPTENMLCIFLNFAFAKKTGFPKEYSKPRSKTNKGFIKSSIKKMHYQNKFYLPTHKKVIYVPSHKTELNTLYKLFMNSV